MTTGLARVTISAPQRRVDVALPEQVPLAELLPEVLRHAGEGLADDGERHGGWVLRRTDGAVLATAQALLPQGVRDGEVLHLVPARAQWPELEYDDVVEAIADGARRRGGAWSPRRHPGRRAGRGRCAARRRAARRAGRRAGVPAGWPAPRRSVALLLTLAGAVASRAYGDGAAGRDARRLRPAVRVRRRAPSRSAPATRSGRSRPAAAGSARPSCSPARWRCCWSACSGLLGVATRLRVFVAGATVGLVGALAGAGRAAARPGRHGGGAALRAGLRPRRAAAAGHPAGQAAAAADHPAGPARRGRARTRVAGPAGPGPGATRRWPAPRRC